ncbi:TPA: hypothetical protein ACN36C_004494 [Vibrio parahaemolyticus]
MNIYCIHENTEKYCSRKKSIENQLSKIYDHHTLEWVTSYPSNFFNLSNKDLKNKLHTSKNPAVKSCFWKHYDALKRIEKSGMEGLIIEDDSIFRRSLLSKVKNLVKKSNTNNFYINIEYSSYDIPIYFSHKTLVKMNGTKRTGGCIVSPIAAGKICKFIENLLERKEKINYESDSFITKYWSSIGINVYWSVHPIIWQGSKTGRFSSELSGRKKNRHSLLYEQLSFYLMPTINKTRAIFRRKIKDRILELI